MTPVEMAANEQAFAVEELISLGVIDMFKKLIKLVLILAGVWAIIHRRVIASYLTGSPMPEAPEWHKRFCPHAQGCCDDFDLDDLDI